MLGSGSSSCQLPLTQALPYLAPCHQSRVAYLAVHPLNGPVPFVPVTHPLGKGSERTLTLDSGYFSHCAVLVGSIQDTHCALNKAWATFNGLGIDSFNQNFLLK